MSQAIRLLRWKTDTGVVSLGIGRGDRIIPVDLMVPETRIASVAMLQQYCHARGQTLSEWAQEALDGSIESVNIRPDQYVIPLELDELWASGVTYAMSRDAREAETTSAQSIYARVYEAARPELFFKAPGSRVVGPEDFVGLREDATCHVPEPELTVILDHRGDILGYTVGNDMTARDLEGENPLYLPQTKTYHHSAAIGPAIVLADTVDPYDLTIAMEIRRRGQPVFEGVTSTTQMRRRIDDLVSYLRRAWPLAPWTGLMTGTGIVPPDEFGLEAGDEITITISEIGTLRNTARIIDSSVLTTG
ncbi:MAG: fumarylacetoacetate hydrolase [Sulfobacillus acidophilus]|uniref:Fumarylacetoacetate hydrolase n=1 Tax=Sulfobacillus acidophilus TaxID=53633 RepID=A0A2T2WF75_9FIRM|nr:MAG: fumarylacetoacetate hydrolase [Sulfobacillus acidophilus]